MQRTLCHHCQGCPEHCSFCLKTGHEVVLDRADVIEAIKLIKRADDAGGICINFEGCIIDYGDTYGVDIDRSTFKISRGYIRPDVFVYRFVLHTECSDIACTPRGVAWPELAEFYEYCCKNSGRVPFVDPRVKNLQALTKRWSDTLFGEEKKYG